MIKQFRINRTLECYNNYKFEGDEIINLTPLSKINFFVGINNSGKSRLLRELFKDLRNYNIYDPNDQYNSIPLFKSDETKFGLINVNKEELLNSLSPVYDKILTLCNNPSFCKPLYDFFKAEKKTIYDKELYSFYVNFQSNLKKLINDEFAGSKTKLLDENSKESQRKKEIEQLSKEALSLIRNKIPIELKNNKVTYIPAIRTLRRFLTRKTTEATHYESDRYKITDYEQIDNSIISSRVMVDYFSKKEYESEHNNKNYYYKQLISKNNIFTGENLYELIKDLRNSPEEKRKVLTDFESFLSKSFFNSLNVSLHSIEDQDIKDIYVKIGDNKELPIFNLGDGIQSIIILTFPLFYYKNTKHFIFYEEPELYLHPGIQRVFIETIKSFDNVQCFIATHSNHFLDTSLDFPNDVSIFSLKKEDNEVGEKIFKIENLASPSVSILNLLGVRNSSVFLSNCSIWVEGVSDRIYIRKYLELYQLGNPDKKTHFPFFKEDFHFSFIEFNGNNITHFNFSENIEYDNEEQINATKISNRIFLIHDLDTGKDKRHELLKRQLRENYFKLEVLEIENLLSPEVLKKTLTEYRLKGVEKVVFNDFKYEDYKMQPIGEFISRISGEKQIKQIVSVGSKSEIKKIYNKLDFAHNAVKNLNNWDELTEESKNMTRIIYNFIYKNNNNNF
ncbi:AAA family ATPase [Adhaeribacter rhizoryzae]|uniref:AAA family ATPase n=1 Tax=Adhaeribacter rhizoryzae TaxID=2607907 RepID=A0A5M6DJ01_9BACT|nr:AAA family ATPase [Adhaeribacter rhizoryzae]KAA5547514.1 AAA family ATPase [Adhaeribacter rhizoryzae]